MAQDNSDDASIKHSDTEITIIGQATAEEDKKRRVPEPVYMHKSSDFMYNNKSTATISARQVGCMSNYSLAMHPRIITKDTSYSFIWIDDQYKNIETLPALESATTTKKHRFHARGFCNLFTILFIIAIILFLFIYPFATFFFK